MTDYLVFARSAYHLPLELLGPLQVEGEADLDPQGLAEKAQGQFGRENWIEMIAIPQSAVAQVIPVPDA